MEIQFNKVRVGRIISFIESLRVPDGALVGQKIALRDWQRVIIGEVYGPTWQDGRRVVRQAVMSIGKKNAKTALIAALTLVHLCGPEAVRQGQLYSLAFDREQAAIVYKYAAAMILMNEALSDRLNIIDSRKKIVDPISCSLSLRRPTRRSR